MTTTIGATGRWPLTLWVLATALALALALMAALAGAAHAAPPDTTPQPGTAAVSAGSLPETGRSRPLAEQGTTPAPDRSASGLEAAPADVARPGQPIALPALGRIGIALAVIVLMAGLFALIFKWQHRIEQSDFFSGIYTAAAESVEAIRLAGPVNDRWKRGEYLEEIFLGRSQRGRDWGDKLKPRPVYDPALEPMARRLELGWRIDAVARSLSMVPLEREGATANPFRSSATSMPGLGGSSRPDTTHACADAAAGTSEQDSRSRCEQELEAYGAKASIWVRQATAQAWDWYQDDLTAKGQEAKANAKKVLNVDFSAIRGRGPEFALEFTAVVIIIFSAVILGVLGVLDSNQIGTLLAAIAGYVLGKGTARGQPDPAAQQQPKAAQRPQPQPQPQVQAQPQPHPEPVAHLP